MILLVTDTSGKFGSVGLARADENGGLALIESVPLTGGTFSAQLVPQIAALLGKHGFGKADIDLFVVISGPGSFTGLRVGLAAIKALAEILHKPIVPVSLLEVVAIASGEQGMVTAVLDAGRGEVYVGEFEVVESVRMLREHLLGRDELVSIAGGAVVVSPDESLVRDLAEKGAVVRLMERPGAQIVANIGLRKLRAGQSVSPDELEANYIRRSDAEIFAKPTSAR